MASELVLHGHDHIHSTMWFEGAERQNPRDRRALGLGAGAPALSGAAYNLFSIERDGGKWRCEQTVRGLGDDASH